MGLPWARALLSECRIPRPYLIALILQTHPDAQWFSNTLPFAGWNGMELSLLPVPRSFSNGVRPENCRY